MAFLDLSFPRGVAAAVSRGLVRKVDILTLVNGEERRNARWRNSLRLYKAGGGIRDLDDLNAVVALKELKARGLRVTFYPFLLMASRARRPRRGRPR